VFLPFGAMRRVYADDYKYVAVTQTGKVVSGSIRNGTLWSILPVTLDMNIFERFYSNHHYLFLDGNPKGSTLYRIPETHHPSGPTASPKEWIQMLSATSELHHKKRMLSYIEFLMKTPFFSFPIHDITRSNPYIDTTPFADYPSDTNPDTDHD
jgi:hypothetical protein